MASKHCGYLVDWLSFTAKHQIDINDVIKMVGIPEIGNIKWQESGGYNFYRDSIFYQGIRINYNGVNDDMGHNVVMSGEGCRTFESISNKSWVDVFRLIDNECVNFARLDLAYDDMQGILDIKRLYKDVQAGLYVSKNHNVGYFGGTGGITINHGERSSAIMIRIYDKKAQTGDEDIDYWVRVEIQLRDDNANEAVRLLANAGENSDEVISKVYTGILNNYLRYIYVPKGKSDTNKSRLPNAPYWDKFIKHAEKMTLWKKPGIELSTWRLMNNIKRNAGQITTAMDIFGPDEIIKDVYDYIDAKGRHEKYEKLIEKEKQIIRKPKKPERDDFEKMIELDQAEQYVHRKNEELRNDRL